MKIASRRLAAALMMLLAGAAFAQPAPPALEVDFTNGFVPLSPVLTIAIAVAVALIGGVLLRRTRLRSRLATWMIAAILGVPVLGALYSVRLIGDAQAIIPQQPMSLAVSPSILVLSNPAQQFVLVTNATSGPIALTRIALLNPGPAIIAPSPGTTCSVGMRLDPGGTCLVLIEGES